jgi:hypothetical protein
MSWHADANTPVPRTLLEWGSCNGKRLIEYHPIGTNGFQAGFLDVEIDLVSDFPSPAVIRALLSSATGFRRPEQTGNDEGSISRSRARSFVGGGAGGRYDPAGFGVTVLSIFNRRRPHP